mgnify:CR=1 FL=1
MIGGSHTRGFFRMLGICSMLVPMPWLTRPPTPFSLKLITAKPPSGRSSRNGSAARQTGQVERRADGCAGNGQSQRNATSTEPKCPSAGLQLSGHMITLPTAEAAAPMAGANSTLRPVPTRMVTAGVTMISTLVSLLTSLPHSAETMAIKYTARGRLHRPGCWPRCPQRSG